MPSPSSLSSVLLGTSLLTGSGTNLFYGNVMVGSGNFYPLSNPSGYYPSSNPSGYYLPSNPSGYLTLSSGVVMTTGNQTISGNKTFKDASNNTTLSTNTRKLYDRHGFDSIDWSGRFLHAGDNLPSVEWGNGILRETVFGYVCINWYSRILSDINGLASVNWETRSAFNSAGSAVVDWENEQLNEGPGTLSVDWGDRKLYTNNGINSDTLSVDWSNRILYDFDELNSVDWYYRQLIDDQDELSIEWQFRELLDENSNVSVKWHYRELKDTDGDTTVDWENSHLYGLTGGLSVDWSGRLLKDTGNYTSADWNERLLKDEAGVTTVDWENKYLYEGWDANDGITSSNLGSDWSAIGNSDLVTKEAVDEREVQYLRGSPGLLKLTNMTTTDTATNGTATVSATQQILSMRVSSATAAYAAATYNLCGYGYSAAGGSSIAFNEPLVFGAMYHTYGPEARPANVTGKIWLGAAGAPDYGPYNPSVNPTQNGLGWQIVQNTITPIYYKTSFISSTANTTTLSATPGRRQRVWLFIESDGAGNAAWYVNGTLLATVSDGPVAVASEAWSAIGLGVFGHATGDLRCNHICFGQTAI